MATEKTAIDFAPGLPDRNRFGDTATIPTNEFLPYYVQAHNAQRAGKHFDYRIGGGPPGRELFSWASKKVLPGPGEKRMWFQQPLHAGSYGNFQGVLRGGYGAGTVRTHDKGNVVVTHAAPDRIKFTVTHKKFPENYVLIRKSGPPSDPRTERQAKSQGGSWLLVNTTPTDATKMLGGNEKEIGLNKLKFQSVPAQDVEKIFNPQTHVQEKIDGASALYHVLGDKIEALSYRVNKAGRPIVHTQRAFGLKGAVPKDLPKELEGTILRGEIYGKHKDKAIPPQELGGLLNSSVFNSVTQQARSGIDMKNMIFDIVRRGRETVGKLTPNERTKQLQEISKYLPAKNFHLPQQATTPEDSRALWQNITSGNNPLTSEGVIAWPQSGTPIKVKTRPESDVWIKDIFPGEGKYTHSGAGGFEYSLEPKSPVVGRVGTGLSDAVRRQMISDPESFKGRLARIASQGSFPSGAHRAPSFIALHEDYPQKAADLKDDVSLQPQQVRVRDSIKREPGMLVYHGLGSGKTLTSIAAGDSIGGVKNVIVPASLRENYKKELSKFLKNKSNDFQVRSYNDATTSQMQPASLNILDEAHRAGREGTSVSQLHKKLQGKIMLLTGTPVRNEPSELVPLLKMIAPDRPIPRTADEFNRRFINEEEVGPGFWGWLRGAKPGIQESLKNTEELKQLLQGRVDYHPSRGEFPSVKSEDIHVDMSDRQNEMYHGLMQTHPALYYKVRSNLPPSKAESRQLNSFMNAVRQVSNNPASHDISLHGDPVSHSPKLLRMIDEIKQRSATDQKFKTLIYSNYLDSGIKPMAERLRREGIPSAEFHGGLNDKARKTIIDDYNNDRLRALLISGAGSEGLDLRGTRMVQVMEPYWNEARIKQVVGRAVRNRSHAHLPEEERNVLVQRYYAKPYQGILARWGLSPETGADKYMNNLSNSKQQLNDELLGILQEVGTPQAKAKGI